MYPTDNAYLAVNRPVRIAVVSGTGKYIRARGQMVTTKIPPTMLVVTPPLNAAARARSTLKPTPSRLSNAGMMPSFVT